MCLLVIIMIVPAVSLAEDGVDLGEVVVETGHEPTLDETAAATVVVPGRDAPLATTTVQLLEQSVGVHARRFGGIDDFSALSLRGSTPSQVQIYLDQVPLVTAQGTLTDLSILPLSALGSAEIYRGGSPGTLAESSIGGVVVLKSKPKPDKFEWDVYGGYGSFDTFRAGVTQGQAIGPFSYRFAYDFYRSAGDFTYPDDNGTRANPNDDRELTRQNNAFTQNALFAKFTYDFPRDWSLEFIDSFLFKGQGIPGLGTRTSLDAHLTTWRNVAAVSLGKRDLGTPHLDAALNVFFDYLNSRFSDPKGEIGLGPQENDNDTYRVGDRLALDYQWGSHQLITGMVAHRSEYFVPHEMVGVMTAGAASHRHTIAGGLEDRISIAGERLLITPSVRVEGTFNHLEDAIAGTGNDTDDVQVSAKLGIKARMVDQFYFRGNVYRGFRQPTFTELFGDRGALVGNPNLKPETAFNFDAGLFYDVPETGWLAGARIEATYFESRVSDLIQFLQTSQFTAKAQNLNDALIRGVEVAARATFVDRLSAAVTYTWQRAKDTSDTVTGGKFLPGRPQHELGAMLVWRERWMDWLATSLTGEYHYMSDMFLDTQNLLEVKDRSIVTAGLAVTFKDRITASFTARNITDDQTVDTIGYPLPGRSYWGEVSVKL